MRALPVLLLLSVSLAACGSRHKDSETKVTVSDDGKTVSGLDIDTDGFKANLAIPGLSFGADDMDMDGMKLYPGSTVRGVRVKATSEGKSGKGSVTMDFVSPATPAIVSAHLATEARKAGFTVADVSDAGLTGTKADKDGDNNHFAFTLVAAGAATKGQMTMTGGDHKSDW